ncbi:hypothetical protein ACRWOO_32775 [Streptomyces sp. NEAU-PBA10]|uniref:Uncharacterized protein n=1 Tax=Streptomyces tremellae TaxID=1124239 RepID=A0ABP7DU87_9ACTN
MVIDWNSNASYACPRCNHDTVADPSSWEVYTCCNCGTRFSRFPRLQRFLRHVGITCEFCTERHPVLVDGKPYGFLRNRHNGIGTYAHHQVEAWMYDTDEIPDHKDRVLYRDTCATRAEAMASLARARSFGPVEDDFSPVLAVVADEKFDRYYNVDHLTQEQRDALHDGTLEVYGVGVIRTHDAPSRMRGWFYPDMDTFTWGLIAPSGLEGLYTKAAPEPLAAHAPQL